MTWKQNTWKPHNTFFKGFWTLQMKYWLWTPLILEESISSSIWEFRFLHFFATYWLVTFPRYSFTPFILNWFLFLARLCSLRVLRQRIHLILLFFLNQCLPQINELPFPSIRHLSRLFTDLLCPMHYNHTIPALLVSLTWDVFVIFHLCSFCHF